MTKTPNLFGGIDIGSNTVKIKIVQLSNGKLKTLEDLSTDLPMGDEVFATKLISDASTKRLLAIIKHYHKLLVQYQVKHYRVVATTSLRQADNAKFVVDAIYRHTGLVVEVIDDSIEKFLTYKSMRDQMEDYKQVREDGTVLVELTSGGCDVSFYRDNRMLRNDEIGIGSLELKSTLRSFIEDTPNYIQVLEEYIETKIDYVSKILKKRQIKNYLIVGGDIRTISQSFFDNKRLMTRKEFLDYYDRVSQDREYLVRQSSVIGKDWHEVLASIVLFAVFLKIINSDRILIPDISLRDGLISDLISQHHTDPKRYQLFDEDPFSASFQTAKRFGIHSAHAKYVHRTGLQLFEILSQDYRLTDSDERILRHAAHLHEIGKSLDLNDYYDASSQMIQGMRLFGVSDHELVRIAMVSFIIGQLHDADSEIYTTELEDLQLGAILAIADALDASKQQKIKVTQMKIEGDRLLIKYKTKQTVTMEQTMIHGLLASTLRIFGLKIHLEEV